MTYSHAMNGQLKDHSLTERHYHLIMSTFQSLIGRPWSLEHPVFIFDRPWLRLEKISVYELSNRLPPDNSSEAPELIKYHQLIQNGYERLIATQLCWMEFGMDDFYRAIRQYWHCNEFGNYGWTFNAYMYLFSKYKKSFDDSSILMPLIILGRDKNSENHKVEWIS